MQTFVEKFGIDWKLMIAQLINFAIVFFILRAFVYKPVLKLLDKRRQKIEDGLAFAEKSKAELASIEELKAAEMKQIFDSSRGRLFLLGLITGLLYFIPPLNLIAPIYAALAFVHLCLAELERLRSPDAPGLGEVQGLPARGTGLQP